MSRIKWFNINENTTQTVQPNLEGDVEFFYSKFYKQVIREGKVGFVQNFSHIYLERNLKKNIYLEKILELGVGSGDHFQFVKHSFGEYIQSDIRVKFLKELNHERSRQSIALDATRVALSDSSIDRVIATCLLLHLTEPEKALQEWRRVTKAGGIISILIPCEPGIMLRAARIFSTNLKAKRLGFPNYKLFNARDHVNHLPGMRELIKFVFSKDKIKIYRFPLPFLSWNFNLFYVYQIKIVNK